MTNLMTRLRQARRKRTERVLLDAIDRAQELAREGSARLGARLRAVAVITADQDVSTERTIVRSALLRLLNQALALDRYAVQDLVQHRVPCRAALCDHPTIQTLGGGGANPVAIPPGESRLGALGLLNGACSGPSGGGAIQMVLDLEGRITRFEEYVPPHPL